MVLLFDCHEFFSGDRWYNWITCAYLFFVLVKRRKSITTARKNVLKLVKLQSFVEKCCRIRKVQPCEIASQSSCQFSMVIQKFTKFANFSRQYFPYSTSFATRLCNSTNSDNSFSDIFLSCLDQKLV